MTASGDTPVTTPDGVEILAPHECWELLRSAEVGRLAVSIMNRPDIFPVNHVVYDAVRGEAWSVVIRGQAVEIEQIHDLLAATDLPLFPWHASPKGRFVRIEPESITGRRFRVITRVAVDRKSTGAMPG
jgi:hypothetical protein